MEMNKQSTTINRAIGTWISTLHAQWMTPVEKISAEKPAEEEDKSWEPLKRFLIALLGSFTFLGGVLFSRAMNVGIQYISDPSFTPVYLLVLVIVVPYSMLFAWLVSWRDFGYGPVRLFLSAVFLPALVLAVIALSESRLAQA